MKKVFFVFVIVILLAACAPGATAPTGTALAPLPTENYPACKDTVCIKQAIVTLDGNNIMVQFDLTDRSGSAEFGGDTEFTGKQLIALYLIEGNTDTYLAGFNMPDTAYTCYAGNDLPWANGKYAATCGFAYPNTKLAVRVKSGDKIRVENDNFDFSQVVTLR